MANYKIILRPDALPLDLNNKHNELEIGFGNGEYTVNYAKLNPDIMLYGFEMSYSCVLSCARRADGVENLKIFRADAQTLLNIIFENNFLDKIYMNFPCPWPKRRHASKRVIAGSFAENFLRVLKLGGLFELVTDDRDYADQTRENFIKHEALNLKSFEINPDRPVKTKYERKWLALGKDIYRLIFEKVQEINNNNFKELNGDEINLMDLNFARPVSEEFLQSLNGVSGRDENKNAFWSFGRYFKGGESLLLDVFAVDDEFKQRYYIKFHDNKMQLDNTASAYMTPAVKNSLKDIIDRFNNF